MHARKYYDSDACLQSWFSHSTVKKNQFALLLKDDCNCPKSTNFAQLVSSTPVGPDHICCSFSQKKIQRF